MVDRARNRVRACAPRCFALALLISSAAPIAPAAANPPPNDECAGAILIGCNQTVIADNTAATVGPGDFWTCRINGGVGAGSIWYRFVATHTSARVQTCASTGVADDSILQVFSGACGGLVSIGCNDDGCNGWLSRVDLPTLTVGETYYIQMSSWTAASLGPYTLEVVCPRPTAIPNCSNPIATVTTTDLPMTIDGTFTGATPDPGPPLLMICGVPPEIPARWIRIVSTAAGGIDVRVNSRTTPALLSVYRGEMCAGLLCHGYGGNGRLRFAVDGTPQNPVTYHLVMSPPFGSPDPDWTIDLSYFSSFCSIPIPPGSQQENEPGCGVPSDTTNGGCNLFPPLFGALQLGVCNSGTLAYHTPSGGAVDSDWRQFTLTKPTRVRVTGRSAAPMLMGIMQPNTPVPTGTCFEISGALLASATTSVDGGCAPATFTADLGPGVWTLMVRPDPTFGWTFNCDSPQTPYLLRVDDADTVISCENPVAELTVEDLPAEIDISFLMNLVEPGVLPCPAQDGYFVFTRLHITETLSILVAERPRGVAATLGVYRGDTCDEAVCIAQSTSGRLQFLAEGTPQNPATYHVVVSTNDLNYVSELEIQIAQLCDIFFPPLAQPENEPNCGLPVDTTNGGCNTTPANFTPITVGTPVRGSIGYTLSGTFDTDWYQFELTEAQTVVVSADAEFNALFGLMQTSTPTPTGDCAEMPGPFSDFATTSVDDCEPAGFTANLGPGVWTVVMLPDPERDWTIPCDSPQGGYVLLVKAGDAADCNENGIPDDEEIAQGARDCFNPLVVTEPFVMGGPDGILDECQCIADWNRDGLVNSGDIVAFLTSWLFSFGGGGPSSADVNCDGLSNSSDISAFITLWVAAAQGSNPLANCP